MLDIFYYLGTILNYLINLTILKIFLKFLSKNKKMRSFKHLGNHITINTIQELENAGLK